MTGLIIKLIRMKTPEVFRFAIRELRTHGYHPRVSHNDGEIAYVYAKGTIPILLVAHADTVHKTPPRRVFRDPVHRIIWSPDGLGADDRAGVAAILAILRSGYAPHVLITNGEESGCWGARMFAQEHHPNVNIIIGLDRRGSRNAVFYSCGSEEVREYIKSRTGFHEEEGTVSDVAIIGPILDIAIANLSVGFYEEHTRCEFLSERDWAITVRALHEILKNPPATRLEFGHPHYWWDDYIELLLCSSCGNPITYPRAIVLCRKCGDGNGTMRIMRARCDQCGEFTEACYVLCEECIGRIWAI